MMADKSLRFPWNMIPFRTPTRPPAPPRNNQRKRSPTIMSNVAPSFKVFPSSSSGLPSRWGWLRRKGSRTRTEEDRKTPTKIVSPSRLKQIRLLRWLCCDCCGRVEVLSIFHLTVAATATALPLSQELHGRHNSGCLSSDYGRNWDIENWII